VKSKVTKLSDWRPHRVDHVVCMHCAHTWVAAYPVGTLSLECSSCGQMTGEPFQLDNVEWFKRFMSGEDYQKRTRVLIMESHRQKGVTHEL